MTKTLNVSLIAALTLCSAIALPRSSYAQFQTESRTGRGVGSIDVVEYQLFQPISEFSNSNDPAIFTLTYQPEGSSGGSYFGLLTMSISIDASIPYALPPLTVFGVGSYDEFTSGAGSIIGEGPGEPFVGNFDITNDGSIIADMTIDDPVAYGGTGPLIQLGFQGSAVPEPSSIAQAGSAVLMILALSCMRRRSNQVRRSNNHRRAGPATLMTR
jgi:hypothetical protein